MPCALIVDDHEVLKRSARALLEAERFTVAEAGTAETGVSLARDLKPKLVLLDIQLPDQDGFEVADRLARLEEPPVVVLVSSRDASEYGPLVKHVPARRFIAKSELSAEAIKALVGTITS
jgi:two-component system, NarL family, nitrate/nitrite response regulator NarL